MTDFQNSFAIGLRYKRAMKWSIQIPPHLKPIATLPCEKEMSEN